MVAESVDNSTLQRLRIRSRPTDDDDDYGDGDGAGDVEVSQSVHVGDMGERVFDSEANGTDDTDDGDENLREGYRTVRRTSAFAVAFALVVYAATAMGVSLNTRGLDPKAVAVLVGVSQLVAAPMLIIASTKVPQWIGVYHQGAIRLVKCSSDFSRHVESDSNLSNLRRHVRMGVWLHFAKFYVVLMPFYCGAGPATVPVSMIVGAASGFALTVCLCAVRRKYRRHRNAIAFGTILLLTVFSSLIFARGVSWIQTVWVPKTPLLKGDGSAQILAFFGWVILFSFVHATFIWHTLRVDEANAREGEKSLGDISERATSCRKTYSDSVFDPRTHFVDRYQGRWLSDNTNGDTDLDLTAEPPEEEGDSIGESERDTKGSTDTDTYQRKGEREVLPRVKMATLNHDCATGKKLPSWCDAFVCNSPEYKSSSLAWKTLFWFKGLVLFVVYALCLYFVIVSMGATKQIASTREKLPAVHEALYSLLDEGPVCAFNNLGAASDIRTFSDGDAAHEAGYLVVHCGACAACSSWQNLIVQHARRDNMAALANVCAKKSLFGGDEQLHNCLMDETIGFSEECAACWAEDITCTLSHCTFLFLQSQMVNNAGNFEVGPDDITSASCEEAHCEVGQFVPCSGATRRRMNITSSIARPGTQQCSIVDVESWEDLFFGSGIA